MDDKQHYMRLGLFVVVSVVLLFALLFILGGRSLFQPKITIETYFNDSVAGLELGSPLKYRGVPLGHVSFIGVSAPLYEEDVPVDKRRGYIVVRATVSGPRTDLWQKELEANVKRGLRVRTELAGVTGQQYLAADFFDPQNHPPLPFDWKPEYEYVPSVPSVASQLLTSIQDLVANLDQADIERLGKNLNALVENVDRKVSELPVAALSADAAGVLRDARAAINRVDGIIAHAPIDEMLRSLASASVRIDTFLADPALGQTLGNAGAVSGKLRKIAESGEIDQIVKNLDRTIQRADALLADNQYDIRGVVQDLRVTTANLRTLSELAKRYPPGLLVGGPPEKVQLTNDWKKPEKVQLTDESKKGSK